jgi:hypothetical protein
VVAISPILLYIGMLIGAQAFQTTPAKHAPAIVLALTPHLAAWSKTLMDGALGAAGTSAAAIGFDKLGQVGVLYHGLEVLGGGSILTGLVLGAIGVFVIEKKFVEASAFVSASCMASRWDWPSLPRWRLPTRSSPPFSLALAARQRSYWAQNHRSRRPSRQYRLSEKLNRSPQSQDRQDADPYQRREPSRSAINVRSRELDEPCSRRFLQCEIIQGLVPGNDFA